MSPRTMHNIRKYTLPELPYDVAALEPHLSAAVVTLHHTKHHFAYVQGANRTVEALRDARSRADFALITRLERKLTFNVAGHVLHSLYWRSLSPHGGGRPGGALGEAIVRDLGSFDNFRGEMMEAAATTMGSGWAALMVEPLSGSLVVSQIHDHDAQVIPCAVPLLVLDAWEHAYALQYQASKESYLEAVWKLWNWENATARYVRAVKSEPHSA